MLRIKSCIKHSNVNIISKYFFKIILYLVTLNYQHLSYRKEKKCWSRESFNYSRAPSSEKCLFYGYFKKFRNMRIKIKILFFWVCMFVEEGRLPYNTISGKNRSSPNWKQVIIPIFQRFVFPEESPLLHVVVIITKREP